MLTADAESFLQVRSAGRKPDGVGGRRQPVFDCRRKGKTTTRCLRNGFIEPQNRVPTTTPRADNGPWSLKPSTAFSTL